MESLSIYESNRYSQFGEDGIIAKIFEVIGEKSKRCVEFGAWDGFHCSNTAALWSQQGWQAVLIEGDAARVDVLKQNTKAYDCVTINRYVGYGKDSLENILKEHDVPFEVDVLSIDVDGDDYHLFESLEELRPRVVLVEYNPTIPWYIDLYADKGNYFGASVSALNRLGLSKGYKLVAITETNCVFVLASESDKFGAFDTDLSHLARHEKLNVVITSYAGEYFVCGPFGYGVNHKCKTTLLGDGETLALIEKSAPYAVIRTDSLASICKGIIKCLIRKFGG